MGPESPLLLNCGCGQVLSLRPEFLGGRVMCPKCGAHLDAPKSLAKGTPASSEGYPNSPYSSSNSPYSSSEPYTPSGPNTSVSAPYPSGTGTPSNAPYPSGTGTPSNAPYPSGTGTPSNAPSFQPYPNATYNPPQNTAVPLANTVAQASSGPNWGKFGMGVLMMVGSITWFVGGLVFGGRVPVYPVVLFFVGVGSAIKGLSGSTD